MSKPSPKPRRCLHLDCFSGASGNMILGSLLELGVPAKVVRESLRDLGIPGLRMRVSKVRRGSISASYVSFLGPRRDRTQRRFASVRKLLTDAPLADAVRERALCVFTRLAAAEARVHGVVPEEVNFHELGAIDALGDIVGTCAALESLGVSRITASRVALGHGSVKTAHGRLPLPVPAALELLKGVPTYPVEVDWETITPTGAALLTTLVEEFGPMPSMIPQAQGFGAGNDREGQLPNVLRSVLGVPVQAIKADTVTVLETNLDDMNPEHLPFLLEKLMEDGALDASLTPLAMKKGRPGQLLRVIARPADTEQLARRILLESSSLGVRYQEMARLKLMREQTRVTTEFGRIRIKLLYAPDGTRLATPEYESCARAARKHGVPLRRVYRAAERAAEDLAT